MVLNVNILPIEELESRIEEEEVKSYIYGFKTPGIQIIIYIQCSCGYECDHIGENIIPRLRLQGCYYLGELSYFTVHQSFLEGYGFNTFRMCLNYGCENELACGDGGR